MKKKRRGGKGRRRKKQPVLSLVPAAQTTEMRGKKCVSEWVDEFIAANPALAASLM